MTVVSDALPVTAAPALEARFAATFDRHYPAVLAYCRRRLPVADAGDAALAAFEVLWRTHPEPLDPLPWLLRVASNQIANARRAERRRAGLLQRLAQRRQPDPSTDPATLSTDAGSARAALQRLRPDDRELLLLVAWDGLDAAQAAAVLGVSTATFAVRLHRARTRLDALLATPSSPNSPPTQMEHR